MMKRNIVVAAGVVGILALVSASSHAITVGPISNINNVTFSQPVALPGVTLPAGKYIFELGPAGTHRDIVRVSNPRGQSFYMGFTREVARPRGMPNTRVVEFGEAVAGAPAPIAVWYPVNSPAGHEFVYR